MRKTLIRYLPKRETVLRNEPLGRFTHLLRHPSLWHPHRRAFARGMAIGTFIGSLPFFGHVLVALLVSLWRRAYIPIAVAMVFVVTGPLTIVPFFYIAYEVGDQVLKTLGMAPGLTIHYADIHQLFRGDISIANMGDRLWHAYLVTWIGSILMGGVLAVLVYLGTLWLWRFSVLVRWHRRRRYASSH